MWYFIFVAIGWTVKYTIIDKWKSNALLPYVSFIKNIIRKYDIVSIKANMQAFWHYIYLDCKFKLIITLCIVLYYNWN